MYIIWQVDQDYTPTGYMLVGDFKRQRFVEGVYDGLWGIPLMYKKWLIKRKFKILFS